MPETTSDRPTPAREPLAIVEIVMLIAVGLILVSMMIMVVAAM